MSYHPIAKTDAIPLRVAPFSNTSQVVTWLTPDYGKLATVIKGAYRFKPHLAGGYDLGYRCELLFYAYARNGLHHFRECTVIDSRAGCRGDWQRTAGISYLCRLIADATPDGAHMPELYHLADHLLTLLARLQPPFDTLLLWFELQLLGLLGLAPNLQDCYTCKSRLPADQDVFFASHAGRTRCKDCQSQRPDTAAVRLTRNLLPLLQHWQRSRSYTPLRNEQMSNSTRIDLCQSMRHFLEYHLDTPPECRRVAYQMVTMELKK